jgi:hypothetical protein
MLLAIALGMWSCSDFLSEINKTGKTEDIVYSGEQSINGIVAACYSYNRLWYGKEGGFGLAEAGTDLWYNARDNAQVELVTYRGIVPELASALFDQYWEAFYAAINLCNLAEKNIKKSATLTDQRKNELLSEVLFLRAFYYWHLVETWGPVQLNLEPVSSPTTLAYRHSVDAIYTQMFADVQFAIDNLPPATPISSRVSHWAAKAFKARLALYYASQYGKTEYYAIAAATAEEVINGSGKKLYSNFEDVWDIKKNATSKNDEFIWAVEYYDVIDAAIPNNYLPPRLNGNWDGKIARRQTNESGGSGGNVQHLMVCGLWNSQSDAVGGPAISADLLRRVCGTVTFYTKESPSTLVPVDVGYFYVKYGMGYTRYAPTRYLMNLFDETKDQRYNGTLRTAWYKHPGVVPQHYGTPQCRYPDMSVGTDKDTVLYYSKYPLTAEQKAWASTRYKVMDVNNTFEADGITPNTITGNTGANLMYPSLKKFENTDSKITVPQTNFQDYFSYRDFPVFRISEMYLIAAEALMGTNQAKALDMFNTLMMKRALPGKEQEMRFSNFNLDFILEERAREFAGENIRWFDLKRTKKLQQQLVHNTKARDGFDPSKHYLRPIPAIQFQATTNKGEFGEEGKFWQNPGY